MANVKVDFSKKIGRIKPLHGVNSGPCTKVFTYDATELFREAGIPFARMHDVEYPYGSGEFVDIHCVFRNFDADENDPASYNFGLTDSYLNKTRDAGTEIFFRLGESIEHAPVKRHIFPPKDNAKWARICEHIIRHYNEGWADGFHWGIRYWEIWNEPDLAYDKPNKKTWAGTEAQFYDFYETAAKHLKSCFPELKIGGPALASNVEWAERFLFAMHERNVPMDFFSWHRYTDDIETFVKKSYFFEELKNKYGYTDAEHIVDEWNYMENWNNQPPSFKLLVGPKGAAFCAAFFLALQPTPVDIATYFEADVIKEWCGIFEVKDMSIDSLGHKDSKCVLAPRKPFYSFSYFNELYCLKNEYESSSDKTGLYVCASSDGNTSKAMLATYRSELDHSDSTIKLSGLPKNGCTVTLKLTDKDNTNVQTNVYSFDSENAEISLELSDEQIYLISVEAK